jgi:diguanylate cyclase (GGDEF)-like protein/PAS domain S-box-containing protein
MRQLSFTARLAFGIAMLTLVIVGSISYRQVAISADSARWVRHSHEVIEQVQVLRFAMEHLDASCRTYVWSGQNSSLQNCQASLSGIIERQEAIRKSTVDNPLQQKQVSLLEALETQQIANTRNAISMRQNSMLSPAEIVRISQTDELTGKSLDVADKIRDEEMRLLVGRDADTRQRLRQTKIILISGTLLGLLIALAAGWSAQRDSGARESAEEALRYSEEQQRLLLNGIQDYAIFMLDPGGRVVSWSAGAERIKGYKADEIIGQDFSIFFIPEDRQRDKPSEILRLTVANGRHEEYAMRVRKDGSVFPAEVILTALRGAKGELRGFSEVTRDLSESQASEARYRGLLEAAPDSMVVINHEGVIALLNVKAENQFGYSPDELVGQKIDELIPVGFAERLLSDALRTDEAARTQEIGTGIELRGRRKDGTEFPIEIMLSPLMTGSGILVTAAIRDITARKKVEEDLFVEKELAQVTLNCIGDAIASTDPFGNITFLNLSAQEMTGSSMSDASGKPIEDIFFIADEPGQQIIRKTAKRASDHNRIPSFPANCILVRRDGSEIPIEHSISTLHGSDGQSIGSVLVFRDVSVSRAMALQMAFTAEHDFLTGLPNRLLLNDRISQAIAAASRNETKIAIMFLDLDGFKHINDSLGHPMGDKLLQLTANRLLECVRAADTVSRQGGDEFVILLTDVVHPRGSMAAARRMLNAIAKVFAIDASELHITTSIGVSIYPDDGLNAETLLKNADIAMYRAKDNGRQSYRFFEPAMNTQAVERQSIEERLRRALQNEEFSLSYQPKVNLKTGEISGAEALIRWTHPARGPISPVEFIPIAEACGLILPIGRWVLREACRQARIWLDAGLPPIIMAVNISALDFRDEHFVENVFTTLAETGWDPAYLELELTESVLMKRAESAESSLRALRAGGVKLAIDDFGTGYSSLSYLSNFSIDTLKIDQSFIRQLSLTPGETTIVASMINMGHSLKLRVVAEGVENLKELHFLQAHDCDEVQGFYFSRPLPPQQFAKQLETGSFLLPAY